MAQELQPTFVCITTSLIDKHTYSVHTHTHTQSRAHKVVHVFCVLQVTALVAQELQPPLTCITTSLID